MSLMSYKNAMPWAEAIRDEVTAGRMPPWPVDPTSPPVKGARAITSREINMIVVWASGGTPQGNVDVDPPVVTFNPAMEARSTRPQDFYGNGTHGAAGNDGGSA